MYILKNAWTQITRNKGRNLLISLIVIVIAVSSTVTLSIYHSANNLIESYKDSYDIEATLRMNRNLVMNGGKDGSFNFEDMQEEYDKIPSLTVDEIKKYGDSSYVKNYYYTLSLGMNAKDLEKATSKNNNMMFQESIGSSGKSVDFTLMGYNQLSAMNEFLSGSYTISDGKVSEDFSANECMINEELATVNNLKVGSSITMVNPNDSTKTYTLKITGIFKDNEESNDNKMSMFSKSANMILTNTSVIEKMTKDDSSLNAEINPTFLLNSGNDIEAFTNELTSKGLNSNYAVSTNLDEADDALSEISNLKTFSLTFLIITLMIGGIVLIILNMINVRERKYEIGVLRTIGMKKSKVAMQFLCELFMVSFVSLIIGLGIGSILSVPVANKLLESEINSSAENREQMNKNFGGMTGSAGSVGGGLQIKGNPNITKVDSIDAVVDVSVVLELLGVGILLTVISSLASAIAIMRFSPLNILKERS